MARTLSEREGRVPLSTLQSHVEYGFADQLVTDLASVIPAHAPRRIGY